MAAHRYWRLYITGTATAGQRKSIAKLEFFETAALWSTPAPVDVSGSGTATASSQYNASYAPSMAFDTNAASSWTSLNQGLTEWIAYDFGAGNDKDIKAIAITGRVTYFYLENPTVFNVQYSDNGTDWLTEWSINDSMFIGASRTIFRDSSDSGITQQEVYNAVSSVVVGGVAGVAQAAAISLVLLGGQGTIQQSAVTLVENYKRHYPCAIPIVNG